MDIYFQYCLSNRGHVMKINVEQRDSSTRYISYVVGFILSIVATVLAYLIVVNHVWPMATLVYVILAIAVIQLVTQAVFFLHIGRGSRWKLVTFAFAILIVLIIVIGTLWIMNNLNYNMTRMTPDQMLLYMKQNEGI
ncbi:MAG: cytochrome o ubiquinol oxidase subunit [Candidatus Saccharibacteria bacterium]|nr:cytochrome o ubiquinol oxidase subunit [Candidatus Saccharibacteria bacterium]